MEMSPHGYNVHLFANNDDNDNYHDNPSIIAFIAFLLKIPNLPCFWVGIEIIMSKPEFIILI